jgi:hypothetical protein
MLAEPCHGADGHDVVQREDSGQVRLQIKERLDGPLTAVAREVAIDYRVTGKLLAGFLQAHSEARKASSMRSVSDGARFGARRPRAGAAGHWRLKAPRACRHTREANGDAARD